MGLALLDRFTGTQAGLVSQSENGVSYTHLNSSTWRYDTNKLALAVATSFAESHIITNIGDVGDLTIAADLTTSAVRYDVGLTFRQLNSSNHLLCRLSNGNFDLYKNAAGYSLLGRVSGAAAGGTTYNVRVEQSGATFRCYLNNALQITHTLSAGDQTQYLGATYTNVGIRIFYVSSAGTSDDMGSRVDNLVVLGSTNAAGGSFGTVY